MSSPMMSNPMGRFPVNKSNALVSWEFVVINLMLFMILLLSLATPSGSLAGRLAMEQEGFNLLSYDMKGHQVYAMAIGPRGPKSEERGVWVGQDGSFRLDQLPVGEYELKVHVPGFATSYDSGIFVAEGKTTVLNHAVALQLSQPSVNIACNTRVFTTHEQPHFWINANGSSKATVRVYRKDMLAMIKAQLQDPKKNKMGFEVNPQMNIYRPYDQTGRAVAKKFFAADKPYREWNRELASDSSDYSHEEFKFEKPLPPGDYFAVAEVSNIQNKSDWNIAWFSVTDIGLIVKQDNWRTVVRAINLDTLKPEPGVKIDMLNRLDTSLQAKGSGTTGGDGFVTVKFPSGINDSVNLMAFGSREGMHAYGGMSYYCNSSEGFQTYFYTDRPVYRLGQTVYFKGIARAKKLEGFTNPGGNLKLQATFEDPDNSQLSEMKMTSSAHGSFHGTFEVPKDGKTGAYQITVKYPDGTEAYERFEVAEYRKPEYQVEVIPLQPRITAGAKGKARIRANYYFGAPVANAKVKYTVFSAVDWESRYRMMDRPAYFSYFDGWDHEDEEGSSDSGYSGDYITEGYANTDANGEAIVEFDTRKSTFEADKPYEYDRYDHRYKVEAEVTDISRLSVLGSGSISVTNGDFALFVQPENYVAKVGESIKADVTAISYDAEHKPVANASLQAQLYRRVYDRNTYTYKGIQTFEKTNVVTDAKGRAHITFATKPEFVTDDYDILITGTDQFRNVIADQTSVWVVSENYPYVLSEGQAKKEPLAVKLDKEVYKAGDVARVMITAPVTGVEGAQAIVAVEGAKLYSYQVVPMTSTAKMVEIPVTLDYAPNVYVTVTFVGKKHQFYNHSEMLKVSPEGRFLALNVETDKPKYKPGDTAYYTITAKYADGKPAANTEVSLGVVDESIYAIRPEATQDIRRFFYSKRELQVVTECSFPEEYSGGPNKIEPRVRRDFRDTAAWFPSLVTDAKGVAKASVHMPDNLTTWRATARAITMNTEVGWTMQKVVSTQDLILRLALPRFFSQGDEGVITAVVHNYTDTPQTVHLTLNASGQFDIKESLKQDLVVEPDKAKRYSWPVRLVKSGEAVVSCKAIGATAGDAMETRLPVLPLGVETFVSKSGVILDDNTTVPLPFEMPTDAAEGSVRYHVYLSPTAIGSVVSNFASLIDYPYGCTEQTMSKLMPSIVAVKMSKSFGMPLSKKDSDKFKDVYKKSMEKLDGYQHSDGGWGWWADDQSSIYLTALVLDGYKMLQESGFAVPKERQDNGLKYLTDANAALGKQLSDPKLLHNGVEADKAIDLSRACYVLSRYNRKLDAKSLKWASDHRLQMTPEALSYFAMGLKNAGNTDAGRTYYDRLIELANTTDGDGGTLMDWGPSSAMFKKLHRSEQYWWYSYRYTDCETTALGLEAVAAYEPANFDRMEQVKRWIMLQRGKDGWSNTKTTAEVFRAMLDVENESRKAAGGPSNYQVEIPGLLPGDVTFGDSLTAMKEHDVEISPKKGTSFQLKKKGPGRLYYTTVLTYYRNLKPGQPVPGKSLPDGMTLRREFFRMVPSNPDSNGNVHFTAEKLVNNTVRAGETVLMKMYVDAPVGVPYVLLKAPLPSGAEVVENDSRASAEDAQQTGERKEDPYNWGNWWWTHQDVMDDHLAFFVTNFNRGKQELHQMVRLELPGKFQMNPVTLDGMYTKGVRAYSQADQIQVTE